MITPEINFWAVLVCGVLAMILGYIWYSTKAFGRTWMALIGKTENDIQAGYSATMPLKALIASLVAAYVLSHFVDYTGATSVNDGITTGFWVWLGFAATTLFVNNLYENRPLKLWMINAGYQLVFLLLAGAILAVWS